MEPLATHKENLPLSKQIQRQCWRIEQKVCHAAHDICQQNKVIVSHQGIQENVLALLPPESTTAQDLWTQLDKTGPNSVQTSANSASDLHKEIFLFVNPVPNRIYYSTRIYIRDFLQVLDVYSSIHEFLGQILKNSEKKKRLKYLQVKILLFENVSLERKSQ